MTGPPRWFAAAVLLGALLTQSAEAQILSSRWDSGGTTQLWSDNFNWFPDLPPAGEVGIGVSPSTFNEVVMLDVDYGFAISQFINALYIYGGADLINSTDGGATANRLRLQTDVYILQPGSSLTVFGNGLQSSAYAIDNGGTLNLNSQAAAGTAIVKAIQGVLQVGTEGTVFGNGRIELSDPFSGAFMSNRGTLSAGAFGPNPPATRLEIVTAGHPNDDVDLDGPGAGGGVVNVFENATLRVEASSIGVFRSDLNLFSGSTLHISTPWSIDGGTVDVATSIAPGTSGAAAHLAGAALDYSAGTMTLGAIDSLALDVPFHATGGVINNSGTITFNAAATFAAAADFNMIGGACKLVVNNVVHIDMPDFNLDGIGAAGNVTTINAGGYLDLNLGAGADEAFSHAFKLNGGALEVTTADDAWSLDFGSSINAGGPVESLVQGELMQVTGNATINLAKGARLSFTAPVEFVGGTSVTVGPDAVLDFATAAYNNTSATYAGAGTLRSGHATVNGATTWNVATVDLDDGDVTLNASLTINAKAIDDAGDGFDRAMVINEGSALTVNIAAGGGWTLDPGGTINLSGDNADLDVFLAGSDLDVQGTINVNGAAQVDARFSSLSGLVIINSSSFLTLNGGNNSTDPNRMTGGSIGGFGQLSIPAGRAIYGRGSIGVPIQSLGEIRADNGVLTLSSLSFTTNTLGTASGTGELAMIHPWNTSQTTTVDLRGGILSGAAINNNGANGINGFGLVSARLVNDTRIDAENSGTLLLSTPANDNDWDGVFGFGQLNAISADLELRDNATFTFSGSITAEAGRNVFANGFQLEFGPFSRVTLTGATYRSTHATSSRGSWFILAGSLSTLQIQGGIVFETGSLTVLESDLLLQNTPATTVSANAEFFGSGNLVVASGTLRLLHGINTSTFEVGIENRSFIDLGVAGTLAQVRVAELVQVAAGAIHFDLAGVGFNDYDHLMLTGPASINGTLNIYPINGFVPALGQTFEILTAGGGVGGTFSTVNGFSMPPGLRYNVIYSPTSVRLQVVSTMGFSADFDQDGDVDGDDLAKWQRSLAENNGADADNDGDSDGADFLAWQRQLGSGPPMTATSTRIPEPATVVLLILAAAGLRARQNRTAKSQQLINTWHRS